MAKTGKSGKNKYTSSSGKSKHRNAQRVVRRCMMKVARWERYQEEIKSGKRKGDLARWDTAGLLRHITLMEKMA